MASSCTYHFVSDLSGGGVGVILVLAKLRSWQFLFHRVDSSHLNNQLFWGMLIPPPPDFTEAMHFCRIVQWFPTSGVIHSHGSFSASFLRLLIHAQSFPPERKHTAVMYDTSSLRQATALRKGWHKFPVLTEGCQCGIKLLESGFLFLYMLFLYLLHTDISRLIFNFQKWDCL